MKIVLAGCTGFIGAEVLAQCLRKSSVTSIVLLTRRPLPAEIENEPKVTPLFLEDWLTYSDDAKKKMANASAAIWALRAGSREVELDYPLAFAGAMRSTLVNEKQCFRYMHVSGVLAERDQEKPLWFLQDGRRVKGMAEIKLRDIAQEPSQTCAWETYIARPSMVLPNPPGIVASLGGWALGAIRVDQLAAAMIDVVEKGNEKTTFENADLLKHAQQI